MKIDFKMLFVDTGNYKMRAEYKLIPWFLINSHTLLS